jgi:hypothetical protein
MRWPAPTVVTVFERQWHAPAIKESGIHSDLIRPIHYVSFRKEGPTARYRVQLSSRGVLAMTGAFMTTNDETMFVPFM